MSLSGLAHRPGPPGFVAAAALLALVYSILVLAGRPLSTDDFWWHLKMGEIYAAQGLDLATDPISHTALRAPEPHQWLFGVSVHAIEQAVGLHGLRVLHVIAVAAILALAFSILRRASGSIVVACCATCAFIAIAWWRLFQLRPDLVSIGSTLLLYRLTLERFAVPSWRAVALAVALLVIWANAHTLFAIGPALVVAALCGCALHEGLRRVAEARGADVPSDAGAIAARWAALLGLGLVATLANPRGIAQHLTFFRSAEASALWAVRDEWSRFDPFAPLGYGPAMSGVTFAAVDILLLLFAAIAIARGVAFVREPSERALRATDPVGLGLGLAGIVALLVATRFVWMSFFALVYVAGALGEVSQRRAVAASWVLAATAVALAFAFHTAPNFTAAHLSLPYAWSAYFANPYDADKYYANGVRFLRETGLEGRLFNSYAMGGFLAYAVSPTLTTFVDGRMNFSDEVFGEYRKITLQSASGTDDHLDVLDRRGVDVYFGVGVPTGRRNTEMTLYTTANLERARGWLLVSRSMRHAIYLRDNRRNESNLRRVQAYYAREGIDFDPRRGLDVAALVRDHPEWAANHNLLPSRYAELIAARESADPAVRAGALEGLGLSHALAGAYLEQLKFDDEAARMRPRAKEPLRRMIYAMLRLDRPEPAAAIAQRLVGLDPDDRRSRVFADAVAAYADTGRRPGPRNRIARDAYINVLPLVGD